MRIITLEALKYNSNVKCHHYISFNEIGRKVFIYTFSPFYLFSQYLAQPGTQRMLMK